MFFVLVDHFYMVTCSLPSAKNISEAILPSFLKILLMSIAVGGVDIFVLISGWFGIHPSKKGLAKYVYQVCFLLWLLLAFFFFYDRDSITLTTVKASFWLYSGYWFLMAYLGLYLLSPILNAFIQSASKRQFQLVLVCLYIFQCYFCWLTGNLDYYGGYSIMFFCLLYLTARYARLYPIKILDARSHYFYCASILFIAVVVILSEYFTGTALRMLRYDNPLVIFASLSLLTTIYKFQFSSRIVNWIAESCFAVYIIHFNPLVFPYFTKGILKIYGETDGLYAIISVFLYLCTVFLCCVFIDRIRIITWKCFQKYCKICH